MVTVSSPFVLGVIPARGGSKGIPNKNIRVLAGKPLIAYSIASARATSRLSDCVVSTDSGVIADVARQHGGRVPFLRPEALATDAALSAPVMLHAVDAVEAERGIRVDVVVMLQPTCPLRRAEDIDGAVDTLLTEGCDSVVSLVDVQAHHPARMYTLEGGALRSVLDEGVAMRPRQELSPVYIRSGDVYVTTVASLRSTGSMMGGTCRAWVIPPDRACNIDGPLDLVVAESLLSPRREEPL